MLRIYGDSSPFRRELQSLSRISARATALVEAETRDAVREVSALQRYASQSVGMGVEAETGEAGREITALRRFASAGVMMSVEALTGIARGEVALFRRDVSEEVEIPVDANTSSASRELSRLIQNISRLSAEIDVDTEEGREDVEALRKQAASLAARAFRLAMEAETDEARRELLSLRRVALRTARDLELKVDVEVEGLSPAQRALAAFRDVQDSARRSIDRFNEAALFARNVGMVALRAGIVSLIGTLAPLTGLAGIAGAGLVSVGAGAGLLGAAALPTATALEALASEEGNVAKASKELGREITASEVAVYRAFQGFRESFLSSFEPARNVLNGIIADAVGFAAQGLPFLGGIATQTANALGRVFDELTGIISAPGQLGTFRDFFERIPQIFEDTASAMGKFAIGLFNILEIAQPFFGRFAAYLDDIMTRFLEWTQSAGAENQITEFFQNAVFFGKLLRDMLVDVSKFLYEIGTSGGARNMAENLALIIDALAQNTEGIEDALWLLGRLGDALVFVLSIPGVGTAATYLAGLFGTLALFGGGALVGSLTFMWAFRRALLRLTGIRIPRLTDGIRALWRALRRNPSREVSRDLSRMTRSFSGWRQSLRRAFLRIGSIFRPLTQALGRLPGQASRSLSRLSGAVWRGVRAVPHLVARGLSGLGRIVARAFGGLGRIAARSVGSLSSAVWRGVRGVPGLLWRGLAGLGRIVWRAFAGLGRIAARLLAPVASAVWRGVRGVPGLLWRGLSGLGRIVARAFGGLGRIAGRSLGVLASSVWRSLRGAGRWFSPLVRAATRVFGGRGIMAALLRGAGLRGLGLLAGPPGWILTAVSFVIGPLARLLAYFSYEFRPRLSALLRSVFGPRAMFLTELKNFRITLSNMPIFGGLLEQAWKLQATMTNFLRRSLGPHLSSMFRWIGESMVWGWIEGLSRRARDLFDYLVKLAQNALKAAKRALGISSPSSETGWQADMLAEGYIQRFMRRIPDMRRAAAAFADAATPRMRSVAMPEMSISRPRPRREASYDHIGANVSRAVERAVQSAGNNGPLELRIPLVLDGRVLDERIVSVNEREMRTAANRRHGSPTYPWR